MYSKVALVAVVIAWSAVAIVHELIAYGSYLLGRELDN